MYHTIYEIEKFPFPFDTIIFFIMAIGTMGLLVSMGDETFQMFKIEKGMSFGKLRKVGALLLLLCIFVFCLSSFVSSFTYGGSDEYEFSCKYYRGNYKIVTGKVENFYEKYSDEEHEFFEEFTVGKVTFRYKNAFRVGFQNAGKEIYENGQKVKV